MTQAAGCKFVRMDLTWACLESSTPGTYNFADADTLYNACAARGIRINFILDYDNPLVYPTDHNSATWRQAFTNYATAAAAHYKGGNVLWELWNEPDGNFGPADQYMALAQQAIPAMRARRIPVARSWLPRLRDRQCYQHQLSTELHPAGAAQPGRCGERASLSKRPTPRRL